MVATIAGAMLFSLSPLTWAVQQAFATPDAAVPKTDATTVTPTATVETTTLAAGATTNDPRFDGGSPLPENRERLPGAAGSGQPSTAVPGVLPPASPEPEPARNPALPAASDSQKEESAGNGVRWTIPPIRWGGTSGYMLQRNSSSSGQSSMSTGMFSTLNASSYIYAPWAATVAGRLGLTTTTASSGGGNLGGQDSQSRNATVVGGGELNIFPVSRFPFQAYFDRSDSRASGNLVTNDYVNTRFGARQTYRGEDGFTNAGLQFDHSTVDSNLGGRDTLTALSGNYGTEIGIVRNSISGRYSVGERTQTGERARLVGLNTTHNATLDDNINLSGNVSYLDNTITGGTGLGIFGDTRTRFLQANAFGTWMPEFEDREDLPLTLSGGVRVGTLHNEFSGLSIDSRNVGANANALYRFSNNFTVGANGAINQVSTSGSGAGNVLLTLVGLTANYASDPLNIGKFSYNWNVGSNVSWQSGSGVIPANLTTGAQAGHTLGRFIPLSDTDSLSLTLGQTVTATQNQSLGNSVSLSHSLGTSYGMRWGEQFSGNASASLSDIMTTGVSAQHYRMLSASFSGMGQLSPISSANINLQFNWNQQTTDTQQTFGFPTSGAGTGTGNGTLNSQHMTLIGSASYTNIRFLGVRGLRYNLLFTADTRMRDDRLFGNVNGEIDRTRWTLNNRFDYRIGLIEFRANAALNDVGGKKNALLFFQVTRQFGAY